MGFETYFSNCLWTYPDVASIAPWKQLTFEVNLPKDLTGVAPSRVSALVRWNLSEVLPDGSAEASPSPSPDTSSHTAPLEEGRDFDIIEGGLELNRLSVVFKPPLDPSSRTVQVFPQLTLFGIGTSGPSEPEEDSFQPVQYGLDPTSEDDITAAVTSLLQSALSLSTPAPILEPCELLRLQITERYGNFPTIVTALTKEAPSVEIRGAIPLDSILDAILGPLTEALGRFFPTAKTTIGDVSGEVRSFLSDYLSIPVALDVLGNRIITDLTPTSSPSVPIFVSRPDGSNSLEGFIPFGATHEAFEITSVKWSVEPDKEGETVLAADLSPSLNFVKTFLVKPAVVALVPFDVEGAAPTEISLNAVLTVKILDMSLEVPLHPLQVQCLPLSVPEIAAVFRHVLGYAEANDSQAVGIISNSETSRLVPTIDEFTLLIKKLGSALNNLRRVANTLEVEGWADLFELGGAVSALTDEMSRTLPKNIFYYPLHGAQTTLPLENAQLKDNVSAVIHLSAGGENYLQLSDSGTKKYIRLNFDSGYSCILPDLASDPFSKLDQIPENSATASDPTISYNDIIDTVTFGGVWMDIMREASYELLPESELASCYWRDAQNIDQRRTYAVVVVDDVHREIRQFAWDSSGWAAPPTGSFRDLDPPPGGGSLSVVQYSLGNLDTVIRLYCVVNDGGISECTNVEAQPPIKRAVAQTGPGKISAVRDDDSQIIYLFFISQEDSGLYVRIRNADDSWQDVSPVLVTGVTSVSAFVLNGQPHAYCLQPGSGNAYDVVNDGSNWSQNQLGPQNQQFLRDGTFLTSLVTADGAYGYVLDGQNVYELQGDKASNLTQLTGCPTADRRSVLAATFLPESGTRRVYFVDSKSNHIWALHFDPTVKWTSEDVTHGTGWRGSACFSALAATAVDEEYRVLGIGQSDQHLYEFPQRGR